MLAAIQYIFGFILGVVCAALVCIAAAQLIHVGGSSDQQIGPGMVISFCVFPAAALIGGCFGVAVISHLRDPRRRASRR